MADTENVFDGMEDGDGDPFVGRVLDERFRVDELIGEGGMGRVYRGHQLSVERDVAIKVLRAEFAVDDSTRERFFREARVVSGLSHPNIVQLVDFGRDDRHGLLFLVMELLEGVELRALLERGRLDGPLALRIAHQVAGALVEAHEHGIVHRDLKADNVILSPVTDGSLQSKVLDFGVAFPKDTSDRLTMSGHVHGTASYMAPEQARGEEVDERADLFSLGILLFEMLTGRLPVEGESNLEVMVKQIQEGPPPLGTLLEANEVPREVLQLVDSLVALDRERRPESARAVRAKLEQIFQHQGWQPVRLDLQRSGVALFEPWLKEPVDFAGQHIDDFHPPAAEEVDSNAETVPATPDDDRDLEHAPTGRLQSGAADDVSPHATTEPVAASEQESDGSSGLLGILLIGIGLSIVIGVPVVGYVVWTFWAPPDASPLESLQRVVSQSKRVGAGPQKAAERSPGGESSDESARENSKASASKNDEATSGAAATDEETTPQTDPVCGRVDRRAVPEGWRAEYRSKSGGEGTLDVREDQMFLRWNSNEGDRRGTTLFIARTDESESSSYRVECARMAGFGKGDECEGVVRRRGPVLTLRFRGTTVCEERFSGTWIRE